MMDRGTVRNMKSEIPEEICEISASSWLYYINREHKVTMYKTLIKPVLLYGAETWVLSKVDELRLGNLRGKY